MNSKTNAGMTMQRLAVALTVLGAPAVAQANDWVELRGDAMGTRASTEISGTAFSPSWTYTTRNRGAIVATPVSVDGVVLTAGTTGDIAAVGLQDGKERWARVLDGGIGATPAVGRGRIVVPTLGGELFALGLQDGQVGWQRPFGGTMNYSSAVLIDGAPGSSGSAVVPAGFPSQDVFRIDLKSGQTQWSTSPGDIAGLMYTSAAVTKGQAIVGMNGGRYQSLDMLTGATRWKFDAAGSVNMSSALVDGDTAYMFPGNEKSELFAANIDTGLAVAGFPVAIEDPAPIANNGMLGTGPAMSSPMLAGGLVILQLRRQHMLKNGTGPFSVAMREYVVAIDPKLKKVVWQHELAIVTASDINGVPELNTCPTPVAFAHPGGFAIAVSSSISPRVAVLDVATGAERWSAALSAPGLASPTFSNGKLLVATNAGVLHAFSSDANAAPTVPTTLATSGNASDGNLVLGWSASNDPEGKTLSYRVRVLEAGVEAPSETETSPGQTSLPVVVKSNTTYHVSVRSRDPEGALSAWSESHLLTIGALATTTTTAPSEMDRRMPMEPMMPPTMVMATMTSPTVDVTQPELAPALPSTTPTGVAMEDDEAGAVGCSLATVRGTPSAALAGAFALAMAAMARRSGRRARA